MNPNYEIIKDEDALKGFIAWLPKCEGHEQYYVSLFSRKKYAPEARACKHDKSQIKRFTSEKGRLLNKIKQLECRKGCYLGHEDWPIPEESLALYISPNPRDLHVSFLEGLITFSRCVRDGTSKLKNPRSEILNVIQTTKTTNRYHVFDIDSKEGDVLSKAREIVEDKAAIIETRGGYHFLVSTSNLPSNKQWYPQLRALADVVGDSLIPVVGCSQGGFIPKFIKK